VWGALSVRELLYPERRAFSPPIPFPRYTTHVIQSRYGDPFDVWLLETAAARGRLLLFHGYFANRYQVLGIAEGLRARGYESLLMELRGHGVRPGPYTFGVKETEDALRACEWAVNREGAQPLPVGLLGLSSGAAVACQVARRLPAVRALVADSVYPRFYPIIRMSIWRRYRLPSCPFVWVTWGGLRVVLRASVAVRDPAAIARQLSIPLLSIQGGQDQVVAPSDSEVFYQAWAGPKERWFDPTVGHVGMVLKDPEAYCNRVAEFFDRTLSTA